MRIFNKSKLKLFWSFSQSGNIWKFIFGGDKYIAGETRDTANKKLFFFTLDYNTGKVFLKNYIFENENFWVSIEGATDKVFYLGRFENPELPYQKNIIAIEIESGKILWENDKYSYLLHTEERIFGIQKKYESNEIAELNIKSGEAINVLSENEYLNILELRNRSEDYLFENSNYPIIFNESESGEAIARIFKIIFDGKDVQNIEYIQKGSLLIFNYYVKFSTVGQNTNKMKYENRFIVYDSDKEIILFEDILNKETNYCVPDNFFIKNNFLFYLKEKVFLNCIKLKLE